MKTKYKIRLLILTGIILAVVLLHYVGVGSYFTLENLRMQRDLVVKSINEHYAWSVFLYILLLSFVVTAALPAAAFLTVASGYFFGFWRGVLYAIVGATVGSMISFLLIRYLLGTYLQEKYATKLQSFNKAVDIYGALYLLAIHWILVMPLGVVNVLAGLTKVSFWTFTWTTVLGIIPSTAIYTFAGQELTEIHSIRDIFTPHVLLAFGILALFAISSLFIAHWWQKKQPNHI